MTGTANPLRALTPQGLSLGAVFLLVTLSLPLWSGPYVLTVATTVFYLALVGQSWNLMLGFAGLLSIGHALFVGIGAYTSAYLFSSLGIPPLIGIFPAIALSVLMGCLIGYLGFRFSSGASISHC